MVFGGEKFMSASHKPRPEKIIPHPSLRPARRVNPLPGFLGRENAVYSGAGRQYSTGEVEGWLSIKTMLSGSAVWETRERRFAVDENCYLILNDRHPYTLRMDSPQNVTTFVLFFRRGLVEDAFRCATTPAARLVDEPGRQAEAVGFFERLEPLSGPLGDLLRRFRRRLETGPPSALESDDWFIRTAQHLLREHHRTGSAIARLAASRPATRLELYCRVLRGRDFLLAHPADRLRLDDVARAACLSSYHFHRAFRRAFGCTPHEYLTRYRLDRACSLLTGTGRSVTDVCLDVGFESLGSFSSLFRRRFGVSPRSFRDARGEIRKNREELPPVSS
jgi:AraC-like DNA-binding protein